MRIKLPPQPVIALAAGTALGIGLATILYVAFGWITVTLK